MHEIQSTSAAKLCVASNDSKRLSKSKSSRSASLLSISSTQKSSMKEKRRHSVPKPRQTQSTVWTKEAADTEALRRFVVNDIKTV